MKRFRAVTRSGTVYESNGHSVRIDSDRSGVTVIRPWFLRAFDRHDIPAEAETSREIFDYIHSLDPVDEPVVGLSLYVSGIDEWRISTPIESLEVFDDE